MLGAAGHGAQTRADTGLLVDEGAVAAESR